MADRSGPAVCTIPPIRAFADALVAGIIAQHGKDRLGLARGTILVPNNRAGQAIREAFVRQAESGLLLPRLVAIGDTDLDERTGAALDVMDDAPLPPAVEPLQRQLILARLIARERDMDGAEAMRLAAELARTLDQLLVEEIPVSELGALNLSEDLQQHWNVSLDQLRVILALWPRELERLGRIDLADRRNRQLDSVAERWQREPPSGFVIAAGISTAAKAVVRLLRTVAWMREGQVVLAGLDLDISPEEWDAIGAPTPIETHPQFHLRQLLDRMKVSRGEVRPWKWSGDTGSTSARARAIRHAFAPAEMTRGWIDLPDAERRLRGVAALELANPAEEAQAIALAIRETIETPGHRVALVTPDRDLAARVSAHLVRWGIEADDSAGRSLAASPHGTLLLAMAEAAVQQFAPSSLLTLLKHPLVRQGEERRAWLDQVRRLDLVLRGPRPEPGLGGIGRFLEGGDERTRPKRKAILGWWETAVETLTPLETLAGKDLAAMVAVLRGTAEALAGEGFWGGQEGREISALIAALEQGAADGPSQVAPGSLPQLLRQLLEGIAIRPGYGGHPRVAIWGLLEARLQSADTVILAGLNEGVWPQLPAPDPWLAPRVRRELGLPGLERRIGLAAHDLACALGAPRVLVTRARRDASSPTIASRFWLRLQTLTGGLEPPPTRYDRLAQALDGSDAPPQRAPRPAPSPPAEERPRSLAVTDVDRLCADPFAFYASALLGLRKLERVDADPGPAWRGSLVHEVLDQWAKADGWREGALADRLEQALSDGTVHPLIRALWLPRLAEAGQRFEEFVAENRAAGREPLDAEVSGHIEFVGIKLRGRADRIDRLPDGGLAIIDYKTGAPPGNRQVEAGFALQLGLIGLIAERGGFEGFGGTALAFEYWSLARDTTDGRFGKVTSPVEGKTAVCAPEDFVARVAAQFSAAAEKWLTGNAPFTAKLRPEYAWADYDQLMRLEEWQGRDV